MGDHGGSRVRISKDDAAGPTPTPPVEGARGLPRPERGPSVKKRKRPRTDHRKVKRGKRADIRQGCRDEETRDEEPEGVYVSGDLRVGPQKSLKKKG